MFVERPHLRFDGFYVARNTYIRTGLTEWRVKNPVHLVCYYRYIRFLPDGTLLYRTSPEVPSKVERSLRQGSARSRGDYVAQTGRYFFKVMCSELCCMSAGGFEMSVTRRSGSSVY
jgi:F-box protein 9